MLVRLKEILKEHLKRKKNHIMFMNVCMNAVNTSSIQFIKGRYSNIYIRK